MKPVLFLYVVFTVLSYLLWLLPFFCLPFHGIIHRIKVSSLGLKDSVMSKILCLQATPAIGFI